MNRKAPSLHASEPRHLPFGKLVDGNLQAAEHLVVGGLPGDVFGDELILQSVVDEILGGDALGQQTAHLVNHAFLEAGLQTAGNLRPALLAVDIDTDNK